MTGLRRRRTRCCQLAGYGTALALFASPARAFFDAPREDFLSAANAGRGGVEAPAEPSAEALLDNPAALPRGAGLQVLLSQGRSGDADQLSAGASWAWGPGLRVGGLFDYLRDSALSPLSEQNVSLLLAVDPARNQSLGLRLNGHSLASDDGTAVQGASLDLGWRAVSRDLPWVPGAWALGLAADNVAGAWPDEDWARAVPSDLRAGLAWTPREGLWFGAEERWTADAALPGGGTRGTRLGAEWGNAYPGLALRAGWRDEKSGEGSLGLGFALGGFQLDLATEWRSGSDGISLGGFQAGLSKALSPPLSHLISVRPSLVLTDPETGRVERASFKVGFDPGLSVKQWRLELRDASDALRRSLGPYGPEEAGADWDGLDEQGAPVEEGRRVSYTLVAQSTQGELRSSSVLELEQAFAEAQDPGVRRGSVAAPKLKPVLGPDGSALQEVAMELPEEEAASWRLSLRDSRGAVQRQFSGLGKPPHELVWDGKDQKGQPVADPLGVSVEFQLRGEDGGQRSSDQPLFSQQAFELARQEAKARPQLALAPMGLPLLSGRPVLDPSDAPLLPLLREARASQGGLADALHRREAEALRKAYVRPQGNGALDLDLYDKDHDELRPDRAALLEQLPKLDGPYVLSLQGLAKSEEKEPAQLARRRALKIALSLKGREDQGQTLLLSEGPPPGANASLRAAARKAAGADPAWEGLSAGERSKALAAAPVSRLRARYDMSEESSEPSDLTDRPVPAALRQRLVELWGPGLQGALTQWSSRTGKGLVFINGWLWVTDGEGQSLRSLWYQADLKADGRIRLSEDGSLLWLRADGWRRWVCLSLETEASTTETAGK
jgi:hypothetical protein